MTSEGLGEMFEGDSADTGGGKFPLVSIGGRAEGLACADPEASIPIGASGNFLVIATHNGHLKKNQVSSPMGSDFMKISTKFWVQGILITHTPTEIRR